MFLGAASRGITRLLCQSMASHHSSSSAKPGKTSFSTGTTRRASSSSITNTNAAQFAKIDSLGRTMTRILRHQATDLNLTVRSDGFCKVDDILKLNVKTRQGAPLRSHTVAEVLKAVEQDNKQRFSVKTENGELLIRANQGHSMKEVVTEHLLKEVKNAEDVPVCVHGTYRDALESIMRTGLKVMGRNHVHFATGLPSDGGVISGMRKSCQVLIYLDAKKALEDGMKLYMSDNNVVLTEGFDGVVACKYFEKVVEWPSRKVLFVCRK